MEVDEPVWQTLQTPRGLSGDERRVLGQLATAVDEPLLRRQIAAATVTAVCRCGCSSVRLHSDEPPIPKARVVEFSDLDRPDYFHVDAISRTEALDVVQVVLHVVQGHIYELEVFAGEGVAIQFPSLAHLTDITAA